MTMSRNWKNSGFSTPVWKDHHITTLSLSFNTPTVTDTIEEMRAFNFQAFFLLDIGDIHVSVMVGVLKLSESVVMWWSFHTGVENPEFFQLRDIVIHDHAPTANNSHLADFSRVEPTVVNDGRAILSETEAH